MSYWSNIWAGIKSTAVGLGVTGKEFFQDPVTEQYPDEMPNLPGWFRAVPLQKTDLSTGAYKCTACGLCEQACPVDTIHIESHQDPVTKKKFIDVYEIDMSRCMLCNYCVEACPFDALVMGNDFEQATDNTEELVYDFKRLLELGLAYSKPEEQAVKSNNVGGGLPDWVFAEKTNATEADMPADVKLGELSCFVIDDQRKKAAAKAKADAASKAAAEAAAKTPVEGTAQPTELPNKPAGAKPATVEPAIPADAPKPSAQAAAEAAKPNLAEVAADNKDGVPLAGSNPEKGEGEAK